MMIKTSEGTHDVASAAVGNWGLGLGIAGTLLGLSNSNNGCGNGGLLGGILGGNNCNNGGDCYERKESALLREQVAILKSENFSREAATKAFQDSVTYTAGLHDKQATNIEKIFDTVIAQKEEIATLKADIRCLAAINEKDHQAIIAGYQSADALEAERRKCGDENIVAWTQAELYKKANYAQYIDGSTVFCPQNSVCGGTATPSVVSSK